MATSRRPAAKKPAEAPAAPAGPAKKPATTRRSAATKPAAAKPAAAKPASARKPPVRRAATAAKAPEPEPTLLVPETFHTSAELSRVRLRELKGALRSELEETREALGAVLKRVQEDLDRALEELESVVDHLDTESTADPETLMLTTAVEKLAGRLQKFRSEPSPTLEDAAKLLRRLDKGARRLRR